MGFFVFYKHDPPFQFTSSIQKKIFEKKFLKHGYIYNKQIKMKKIIRLTERDLTKIVKRVIKENEEDMIRIPTRYYGVRM